MKVRLKFQLECSPDVAWDLIRSSAGLSAVFHPLLDFEPKGDTALPDRWSPGRVEVVVRALWGMVPVGEQAIVVSLREKGPARILTDAGGPTAGPLTVITRWHHQLAVAPAPGNRTLYRDQLTFSAGVLTPLLWPALWAVWQWRGSRLRSLAARLPRA